MSDATEDFARRLMAEVWLPFDANKVAAFYHRDMIGYHGAQLLAYQDVVNRLAWDALRFENPVYDVRDIIAATDKFAIRFLFGCKLVKTGQDFTTEVTYFYHLRDGKVSAFWLLSSGQFDYKEKPD